VQFLAGASTTTLAILSTSSASKTPDQRCAGDYIGSGPFTLKNYTQGQSAQVVNRKDYAWPSALAKHKGAAYLDEIDFQVVDTSNARDGALESRQAGVAIDIATQDMPALKGAGVSPLQGTQSGMPASFIVNTTRPGLSDAAVRQAIMIGFDRASDVKAVLGAFYSPATSVLTKNLPQYTDESAAMAFDAAKAKSTLDGAGWLAGPDGIRSKDGVKLDFTVTYTSTYGPYYTSLLQLFQQQMKDIGIGIALKNLTQAGVLGVAPKHDFDFYMSSLTDADPDIIRSSAVNFLFADQNALKSTGISGLFTQSQSDADPTARKATYAKIQDALISNGFIIPFWEGAQLVGAGKQVSGLALDFQSWLLFYDVSLNG
jgi:peptide/nickel transport system substrate-binding protein